MKKIIFLLCMVMFFFKNSVASNYEKKFYDFSIESITGETINFENYKNKVILVVNTASYCGFTKQYDELQELWDFTHNSGVHATIAGVLLAMTIPHRKKEKDFSLLIKIEHAISPYVAFGIMPLFAFANAGVSLEGLSFSSLLDKVPLGIVLGLFLGKQLGVFVFSYVSIKLKVAQMPNNTSWYNFYGVGVLTGIGFTMSLFVGNLAFVENMQYMDGVKIGVLTGSLLSTLFGYFLILLTPNKPNQ